MGRYGSGGHNRTHNTVEDYYRIDSFRYYDFLRGDKYLWLHDTVAYPNSTQPDIVYHVQERKMEILTGYKYSPLLLSEVPGVNGNGVRVFFECPHCGKRIRYLYKNKGNYMCRNCLNANYKSQQINGKKKLRRKMLNIVEKKMGYTHWRVDYPGVGIDDLRGIPRPRYMRDEKYTELMLELRQLQDEYKEREFAELMCFLPPEWLNNILG